MTERQEYCDIVEPDINLLKVVLENASSNEFHEYVTLEAVKQNICPLFMNQPSLRRP